MAQSAQMVGNRRIETVDMLRGFALAGLFLVHVMESFELHWMHPVSEPASDAVFMLLMGKSFALLAMCFGFSFFILMDRAEKRGEDFTARFAWRLTLLFGIATIHTYIYRGDIMQTLALLGFPLLLVNRIKDNRILLALAIFCLAGPVGIAQIAVSWFTGYAGPGNPPTHWQDPAMRVYLHGNYWDVLRANLWIGQWPKWWYAIESGRMVQIFGLYLVGLLLGRVGFFADPGRYTKQRWIAFALIGGFAFVMYFALHPLIDAFRAAGWSEGAVRAFTWLIGSYYDFAGSMTWMLVIIALSRTFVRHILQPLVPMGRLTLTLYVAQSVICLPLFYGFGFALHDKLDAMGRLWLGLGGIALQMIFAAVWLRYFRYGPLEWVWRALTYWGRKVPLLKREKAPAPAAF